MTDWQDISTAPKDGTRIHLVDANYPNTVEIGFWSTDDKQYPWVVFDVTAADRLNGWLHDGPTHWAPLLKFAPPAQGGA